MVYWMKTGLSLISSCNHSTHSAFVMKCTVPYLPVFHVRVCLHEYMLIIWCTNCANWWLNWLNCGVPTELEFISGTGGKVHTAPSMMDTDKGKHTLWPTASSSVRFCSPGTGQEDINIDSLYRVRQDTISNWDSPSQALHLALLQLLHTLNVIVWNSH